MNPIDQSTLVAFGNAAAGHEGVLSDPSGSLVVKPCTHAEIEFYESASQSHPGFAKFMPTFMGTLTQAIHESKVSTDDPVQSEPSGDTTGRDVNDIGPMHGKALKTDLLIAMENIAAGFQKPNILDVKLGARLWDDDAPVAKRARLDGVASKTTSSSLGFRIAGMKVWGHALGSHVTGEKEAKVEAVEKASTTEWDFNPDTGYTTFNKLYGRGFSADNVVEGFRTYHGLNDLQTLSKRERMQAEEVLDYFIGEVRDIREMLEHEESRMYSSSILFVYEGDRDAYETAKAELVRTSQDAELSTNEDATEEDDEDEIKPKLAAVKLIDFAHAHWVPGGGPDENALFGVKSTLRLLEELKNQLDAADK